jgi:hypothetical protein
MRVMCASGLKGVVDDMTRQRLRVLYYFALLAKAIGVFAGLVGVFAVRVYPVPWKLLVGAGAVMVGCFVVMGLYSYLTRNY